MVSNEIAEMIERVINQNCSYLFAASEPKKVQKADVVKDNKCPKCGHLINEYIGKCIYCDIEV